MKNDLRHYTDLLNTVKTRIRQAQTRASLSANAEMILMYWDIGQMIHERQQKKGWGAGIIPRLAKETGNWTGVISSPSSLWMAGQKVESCNQKSYNRS